MKRFLTGAALIALSIVFVTPGAHACKKNTFGLCSGDCPKSTPVCSTKLGLDGITCECTKKTKNQLSSAVVAEPAEDSDPIVDMLIDIGLGEE